MRTIEYYGCDTTNNTVMWNIANTWGHGLEGMSAVDKGYLLWQLPEHYLIKVYPEQYISTEVDTYCEALAQDDCSLDILSQVQLLRSLTNRFYGKPLGYWGLDYDHPMISFLYGLFGEGFANINTTDAYVIISSIGHNLCKACHHQGFATSDEVEQIGDAIANYELPEDQVHALIQALGDA